MYSHDVSQELFHCFQVGVQAIAKARVGGDTVEMDSKGEPM